MLRRSCILLCFLGALCVSSGAAPLTYGIVAHYTNENGLPQNSVYSMAVDSNQFVWFTCWNGILRYDGNKVQVRYSTNGTTSHLRIGDVVNMDNQLLLVQPDFALKTVNHFTNGRLYSPVHLKAPPRIFAFTPKKKLITLNESLPAALIPNLKIINGGNFMIDRSIYACQGRNDGYIKIGSAYFYYDQFQIKKTSIPRRPGNQCFYFSTRFYCSNEDKRIICWDKGVETSPVQGQLVTLLNSLSNEEKRKCSFISDDGNVFLKTATSLYHVVLQDSLLNLTLLSERIDINDISCIVYRPQRNLLLIGSLTEGFFVLKRQPLTCFTYDQSTNKTGFPTVNSIYAIHALDDTTFISVYGKLRMGYNAVTATESWDRYNMMELETGKYLVGAANEIQLIDQNLKILKRYKFEAGDRFNTHIISGDTGYMNITSSLQQVVKSGDSVIFLKRWDFENMGTIHSITKAGNMIFIGGQTGFYKFNLVSNALTRIDKKLRSIRELYAARNGTIWIGTNGDGWFRYKDNRLTKMPLDLNRYMLAVHAFAEDRKGFLWLSTNHGLFRLQTADLNNIPGPDAELYYNQLDKSYGSLSNEYNGGANPNVAISPNGYFAFPSLQGVVTFHPDSVAIEQTSNMVILEDFEVDGRRWPVTTPLELRPDVNYFKLQATVHFTVTTITSNYFTGYPAATIAGPGFRRMVQSASTGLNQVITI